MTFYLFYFIFFWGGGGGGCTSISVGKRSIKIMMVYLVGIQKQSEPELSCRLQVGLKEERF